MTARTVAEHQDHIRQLLTTLDSPAVEAVALSDAVDRTTAHDVYAPIDLPVFRNSAMDGYAVRAASIAAVPVTLPVAGTIAAGDAGRDPLPAAAAVKIMTGAPLPPGADCVVPVEDTDRDTDVTKVTVRVSRAAGDFVREPGDDVARGQLLLPARTLLAARHIGALAAVGITTVDVRARLTAAVITTGNELVPGGTPLGPGQIYNSNGITLAALLASTGVDPVSVAHSTDDPADFRRTLAAAVAAADFVVTSGGVSMGDFEVVKETLAPLGGQFGHVALQPGGPQGTAVVDGVPVFSFPGNPVSTVVSFEVFLRPVLRELAGLPAQTAEILPVTADLRSPAGRRQFLRGRRVVGGVAPVSGAGSHLIVAMAAADVLIDVPAEVTVVLAGSPVRVLPL